MAAFAFATAIVTPAMAQQKGGKGMRDPKARTEKMATKLNFSDAQRAQLDALNKKYPGADFDRKAYHQEFRAILTDAQKEQIKQWREQHKAQKGQKGEGRKGQMQENKQVK